MPAAVEDAHPAAVARGEDRARRIREMFADIAPRYDLVNRLGSLGRDQAWRRALVRELRVGPGATVLDACCGTGDVSRELSRQGIRAIGIDFCRPMLVEGRRPGRAPLTQLMGDARALPLRSGSVDGACVAFGLRNVVPPEAGLAEMARVTRPGGRVAILEFSRPSSRLVRAACGFYERHVLPRMGDLVSGCRGTYRYLPDTIDAWHAPESLAALMAEAGLISVTWRRMMFGAVTLHVGVVAARPPGGRT